MRNFNKNAKEVLFHRWGNKIKDLSTDITTVFKSINAAKRRSKITSDVDGLGSVRVVKF